MDTEALLGLVVLSFVIKQLIESLVKPVVEIINLYLAGEAQAARARIIAQWPFYLGVGIGAPLLWFTGVNALPAFHPPEIGRVLTCLAAGLGPSFIFDLVKKPEPGVTINLPPASPQ